ncbi:MAG: hypothetical protein ACM3SS_09130 [Rhodospirillaceae bacterium]
MPARFLVFASAALLWLTGCGWYNSRPPATEAPYLATKFCGVVFDGRTKEARFSIDLTVRRRLPAGAAVEVSFENPLERDKPLVVTREVKGDERELRILSAPVKGITPREYAMAVRIYAARDRATLLGAHTEVCRAPVASGDIGIDYR